MQICTTPLFYIMVFTCFGSNLPSSGSFLDHCKLLEIQIEWVVYYVICVTYQYNDGLTQLFTKYKYIWLWLQCFNPNLGHRQAYIMNLESVVHVLICNVWLRGRCAGVSWFRHTGHVATHYKVYHPFRLYFK
jgi:hypothetical protein